MSTTLALLVVAEVLGGPLAWIFHDASHDRIKATEAILYSRDRQARLVVRCDVTGQQTLSVQYKPAEDIGLSMGPITLDWMPSKGVPLSSKLVWEPDRKGAFARDSEDDRNASDVALALETYPGTLRLTAFDRDGDRVETLYDNGPNREVIGRILAQCPWDPQGGRTS